MRPVSDYQPNNTSNVLTKSCITCRISNSKQDVKRDKENRNALAREAEKKPERKAVKTEWKENNYEKVSHAWMNSRSRRIEKNQEEYLKKQAENMKQWRENNPEKVMLINENRVKNIKYAYREYRIKTRTYNYEFKLTFEQFETLVKQPCNYCGCIQEKGFNGVDRVDSGKGYLLNNVVSCCYICNRMKGAVDNISFLQKIEHILSHNKLIFPKHFYSHLFMDQKGTKYETYKNTNQNQRQYEFTLTEEQYYNLINECCYICGKQPSLTHKNGIDRFDNDVGYLYENCNSCCGQCNYMKNNLEYEQFINKLIEIYKHSNTVKQPIPEKTVINHREKNVNKKSKEELREQARIRKERQRKLQREQYGDEEFRKMRSAEIAENRRKRKEQEKENKQ